MFVLFSVATSYKVTVRTGDVRGAGTDANVYVQIFGKQGDTGKLPLRQSQNTKNKFERGRADMFTVEAVDIGKVSSAAITWTNERKSGL
jgi:hypothetical protein